MGETTRPVDLAAFIRDIEESTASNPRTIADQTKDGFAIWCHEAAALGPISSPLLDSPKRASDIFLNLARPAQTSPAPKRQPDGTILPEDAQRHAQEVIRWEQHKRLYDQLFSARTPPEKMELVITNVLLVNGTEKGEIRRHLFVAPAEVVLDSVTGELKITAIDAFDVEINWTPGEIRERLTDRNGGLEDLQEAQSQSEVEDAVLKIVSSFGTKGSILPTPNEPAILGSVGLGSFPAVLLRKKESSAFLQTLRDMAADIENGGFVSDPFMMIVDPEFRPDPKPLVNDEAALPLPANVEQRSMIDRARSEPHMVIQGPPGTGKTHTIANLAAVLMAEGRRVLITAENDRALSEVQSKLPNSMKPLMLPMLRERGTGLLEASVNALNTRAGSGGSNEDRLIEIGRYLKELDQIQSRIDEAEIRLIKIADADRETRSLQGISLPLSGHQQVLSSKVDQLEFVDQCLGEAGHGTQADASLVLELFPKVTPTHEHLQQLRFPDGLLEPGELATWLSDHRSQLAVLGDPTPYNYGQLIERVDELAQLSRNLQQLPPIPWSQILRTSDEYLAGAKKALAVRSAVNHGVTVDDPSDRSAAASTLTAYLKLDADRFDQPLADLVLIFNRAKNHVQALTLVQSALFTQYERATELTTACESALQTLDRDGSGLLTQYVTDHRIDSQSKIDLLIEEARQLLGDARIPLGLPVQVLEGAPPAHELLRQAEALKLHLDAGGKMKRAIGTPKAVKDVAELTNFVRVDGSEIDTIEEADRAIDYFRFQKAVALCDEWANQHRIEKPETESHFEWLKAITMLPDTEKQIADSLNLVDSLITFTVGNAPKDPASLLKAGLATVSNEIIESLSDFMENEVIHQSEVRIDGVAIRSRAEALQALESFQACEVREKQHLLLPSGWAASCNALDVGNDVLVRILEICAAAAAVPGEARSVELTPSSVNQIVEKIQTDNRRAELQADYERVVGRLNRALTACVPKSPATQAIEVALGSEDVVAYRSAVEELRREQDMAEMASQLEKASSRLSAVHPRLVAEFELGNADAEYSLESLEELQSLRDYRAEINDWKLQVGSTEPTHKELAELYGLQRRTETKVAELRCWNNAINRLQSRRELRSSLSALSTAMDRVPKTRTAKTFPARMRALRNATRDAAPAIPCWVMTVDRTAEVLGYPTGEDRFDVVIVDEASQAWFPSMFLYAIADQVIIVGDDLQTSPSTQVVNETEIRAIVREHIPGHRLADQVGGDLSLYDVAAVMTGPDTMVDHFRCVPEIIDLSNRLSYAPKGKTLKPSRVREPGALEPVIQVQVTGARSSSASANPIEIAAVVKQVIQCHADRKYAGMDFGVVVAGTTPTAHVAALTTQLLDNLGPIAMEQRNLEIGVPSQFQGAERNVMFLSLLDVAPPGGRLRKWPHEHTGQNRRRVQQLNVAVSRAKDQLWIFRSFDLQSLAPDDARAIIVQSEASQLPILEEQLKACGSNFERDVVRALAAADPTLIIRTQVEAIGYAIDVVIENNKGHRLAVECDGDRWHSERSDVRADLYRQRTLEAIGWQFDRFLASEWYADPAGRTQETLDRLRGVTSTLNDPKVSSFRGDGPPKALSKVDVVNRTVEYNDSEEEDDDDRWADDYVELDPSDYSDLISAFDLDRFLPKARYEENDPTGSPWHEPTSIPEYLDRIDPQSPTGEEFIDFEFDELLRTDQFDDLVDEIEAAVGDLLPETPERLTAIVEKPADEAPKPKAVTKPKVTPPPKPVKSSKQPEKTNTPSQSPAGTSASESHPDRPTAEMTRKESNRLLAAAMRGLKIEPRGEPWERAKRLLDEGATFDEAAASCVK